jgi:hypothetical protein
VASDYYREILDLYDKFWDELRDKREMKEARPLVKKKATGKLKIKDRHFLRPYLNDPIVVDVIERIKERADKGMAKYGVPMTRPDVTTVEWLRHAQEEAMDLAIYLERCIRDLEEIPYYGA